MDGKEETERCAYLVDERQEAPLYLLYKTGHWDEWDLPDPHIFIISHED